MTLSYRTSENCISDAIGFHAVPTALHSAEAVHSSPTADLTTNPREQATQPVPNDHDLAQPSASDSWGHVMDGSCAVTLLPPMRQRSSSQLLVPELEDSGKFIVFFIDASQVADFLIAEGNYALYQGRAGQESSMGAFHNSPRDSVQRTNNMRASEMDSSDILPLLQERGTANSAVCYNKVL
jgi:hypothetical protein